VTIGDRPVDLKVIVFKLFVRNLFLDYDHSKTWLIRLVDYGLQALEYWQARWSD
jgi:hypothetical protein